MTPPVFPQKVISASSSGHNNGMANGVVNGHGKGVAERDGLRLIAQKVDEPLEANATLAPTARVLFIGATGRVGHQVLPLLSEDFAFTAAALGGGQVAGTTVSDVDITDLASVEAVVRAGDAQGQPFDAIVNCAIADSYRNQQNDAESRHLYEEQCIEVNARGAYHVYEAARRAGVPRVVFVSSMTAVLGQPRYDYIGPDTLDRPRDVYAACKMFGENVGRSYAYPQRDGGGLQVSCLRLGMPYPVLTGSDQAWQENIGRRALIVHIEDVAHSIRCALQLPPAVRFGIYTIVSDSDNDFVSSELYAGLGYSPGWNFGERAMTSIPRNGEAPVRIEFPPRELNGSGKAKV